MRRYVVLLIGLLALNCFATPPLNCPIWTQTTLQQLQSKIAVTQKRWIYSYSTSVTQLPSITVSDISLATVKLGEIKSRKGKDKTGVLCIYQVKSPSIKLFAFIKGYFYTKQSPTNSWQEAASGKNNVCQIAQPGMAADPQSCQFYEILNWP